ncbi:hypothetical protein BDW02DRAFT_644281 [Decorospora gaudefroyi]|uniref:Ricin B lectin domain-containing protein n=1 Tax=Decorospora gaudefroyi TaxID=184978 RepID=A0A6A5KVC6_9PLEO|nr:hypothetical protein BDW02DRAFT_644281 [Decorospora gaudefroyi]
MYAWPLGLFNGGFARRRLDAYQPERNTQPYGFGHKPCEKSTFAATAKFLLCSLEPTVVLLAHGHFLRTQSVMEIDSNYWYHLTSTDYPRQSLSGTRPPIDGEAGLVTVSRSANSSTSQQWQLFSLGASGYALRTAASGPHGYLTMQNQNGTCEESTPIISIRSEDRISWRLASQGDNATRLGAYVRGQACFLGISNNGSVHMSSNTTRPQLAFVKMMKIHDLAFSTVATPSATLAKVVSLPTTTAMHSSSSSVPPATRSSTSRPSYSQTPIPSSTSSPSPSPPTTPNLSPSAAIGMSVALGILGIILILTIALIIHRRWKHHRSHHHHASSRHNYRQARLWKGFEPATLSTARTTFVGTNMAGIYFAELPTPVTPGFVRGDWDTGTGSEEGWGQVSPLSPRREPVEMAA